MIVASEGKELDAADAFKLQDTFGFPIDLTREILEEKGMTVNEEKLLVPPKEIWPLPPS